MAEAPLLEVCEVSQGVRGCAGRGGRCVSLSRPGDVQAVIGPNGAGKTHAVQSPDGAVGLRPGTDPVPRRTDRWSATTPDLAEGDQPDVPGPSRRFSSLTVRENVQTVLLSRCGKESQPGGQAARLFENAAATILAQVGLLAYADDGCGTLSLGDLKRMELALALASEPALLLLDEPTAGMSSDERADLMGTGGPDRAGAESDGPVHRARHGCGVRHGNSDPRDAPGSRAGRGNAGRGAGESRGPASVSGRRRDDRAATRNGRRGRRAQGRALLEVTDLEAGYGMSRVLFGVEPPRPRAGRWWRSWDGMGPGKSTTLKAIMGILPPTAGRVVFDGRDVSRMPSHLIARAGVGYVPQDRRIFPDLTVRENLEVGRHAGARGASLGRRSGCAPCSRPSGHWSIAAEKA